MNYKEAGNLKEAGRITVGLKTNCLFQECLIWDNFE